MLYLTTALVERVEREVFRPSPPEDRRSLYYIRKLLNFKRCFAANNPWYSAVYDAIEPLLLEGN